MTDTDITALVERLREYVENIRGVDEPPANYLCWQAADALEALQESAEYFGELHRQERDHWKARAEKAEAALAARVT